VDALFILNVKKLVIFKVKMLVTLMSVTTLSSLPCTTVFNRIFSAANQYYDFWRITWHWRLEVWHI